MSFNETRVTPLPVGFETFHRNTFINYQLNRAVALGFAERKEIGEAAEAVRTFADCVEAFERLGSRAESEQRLRNATAYMRLAEFFTPQQSEEKTLRYERHRRLFDLGFSDSGAVRHEVPYEGASMPAYRLGAIGDPKGLVLFHGGFDSLIEEFYVIWERIAAAGFDVIAFDGPGQGGARILSGLTFDHDWEKPTGAILDYFQIDEAALVGLSMGGYWAVRAASREPRITKLVIWPPVYDWMERVPSLLRGPAHLMIKRRGFMNWSIRLRARLIPVLDHAIAQALYLSGGSEPMDAVDWFLGMNAEHLGSDRVGQDVLVLVGEEDTFQPPVLAERQVEALSSARSIEVRSFTTAEHAASHCQMGNLDLACATVTEWLDRQMALPS